MVYGLDELILKILYFFLKLIYKYVKIIMNVLIGFFKSLGK